MTKSKKVDLLSFEADDNGNAECMKELYGDQLIYNTSLGWLHYVGTHWQRVSDAKAYEFATETLRRRQHSAIDKKDQDMLKKVMQSKSRVADCVYLYQRKVAVEDIGVFDNGPDLLNCLNGVVNLRTGSIEHHKPCQMFTYCIKVEYRPDADMSLWNDFIHESVSSESVAHFLQRAIGYSFTGHTSEEKLFYPYGPGRAGKGTFTETILAATESPLSTGIDFNTFTAKRDHDTQSFDLAPLKPARFIVASESNRYQSLNPARIKQITGGDPIRCAFKNKEHFTYRPQFKVWLVNNHIVSGDPEDDALWWRVLVIHFPHSHIGFEDTTLKERMRSVENLEGVLRWIVEGAMEWYKKGLDVPQEVLLETRRHREAQDYVSQWLESEPVVKEGNGKETYERTLFSDGNWESAGDLMKSFKAWCIDNNVKPVNPNQFSESLIHYGLVFERHGKNRTRGYKERMADGTNRDLGSKRMEDSRCDLNSNRTSLPSAVPSEKPQQNGHTPGIAEQLAVLLEDKWHLTPTEDGWFNIVSLNGSMPNQEGTDAIVDFLADHKDEVTKMLLERHVK